MEESKALEIISAGNALVRNTGKAVGILNEVLAERDPYIWFERGKKWKEEENWKDAVFAFERAVNLKPEMQDVYPHWAYCHCKMGNVLEAIEVLLVPFLQEFLSKLSDFDNQLTNEQWKVIYLVFQTNNHNKYNGSNYIWFDIFWRCRFGWETQKKFNGVTFSAYDIIHIKPLKIIKEIKPENEIEVLWLNIFYGIENLQKREYHIAINNFTKAIEINPKTTICYKNRGFAKVRLNDDVGAIEDFTKLIELDNTDAISYFNRGSAKHTLKDYISAIDDYSIAIEIDPYNADFYYSRGKARYDMNDYQASIDDNTKAIQINSKYSTAYHNRGSSKFGIKDFKGAIEDYSKSIEINPKYSDAYRNRSLVWKILNELDNSAQDWKSYESLIN